MTGLFQDKVELITGGSSGIGRAAALVFAREGAKIILADVVVEGGQETVQMVREAGGSATFIEDARRVRKMFGGGMRQAGIIAAAGLVALDETLPLLAEDNRRAHELASGLASIPAVVLDPDTVETNIVFFSLTPDAGFDASGLAARLAEEGVLCLPLGHDSIRMLTHYHISDDDITRVVDIAAETLGKIRN